MMDSESPELVAFYQQYNYEFVKDIFMDTEVVPSLMKSCLVGNCELDHNNISCMLNSNVDINSESTSGTLETVSNDSCKDGIKKCGSVNLVMELGYET
ncbi:hypothetical protein Dsin_005308 [Dipteronia sinensis]|uniref:Uncharacterized protein n=1 Tax=Dipteronia sinensis TaxID=43782 RepID=A0AAE0AW75_9ROSI|nr:hypothetical protein Dsin_005308 [Dipteronia sinensis]